MTDENIGMLAHTRIGARGDLARINYREAKPIVGYIEVPDEAQATSDPKFKPILDVPPIRATSAGPPVGGVVAIAQLSHGHAGVQAHAFFDVPQKQIVRIAVVGSFAALTSMLVPKYYKNVDGFDSAVGSAPVARLRQYLLTSSAPGLTLDSALWNALTQDILPLNIRQVPQPGLLDNPNAVSWSAWFGERPPVRDHVRPRRRFYGTVVAGVGKEFQNTRCPVASFASYVTLIASEGLGFFVNGPTSAGAHRLGPFPVNRPVPIPDGATSIDVADINMADIREEQECASRSRAVDVVGLREATPVEVAFELDYTLSGFDHDTL